jgi:hypothetical protein
VAIKHTPKANFNTAYIANQYQNYFFFMPHPDPLQKRGFYIQYKGLTLWVLAYLFFGEGAGMRTIPKKLNF